MKKARYYGVYCAACGKLVWGGMGRDQSAMKTEQDALEAAKKRLKIVGFCVLALYILLSLLLLAQLRMAGASFTAAPEISAAELAWVKERHRHHGIWHSEIDRGRHYFRRDGQRIPL